MKKLRHETTNSETEPKPCLCENCVTLAVCRLKEYFLLVSDCQLIRDQLYRGPIDSRYRTIDFLYNVTRVRDILQPRHWEIFPQEVDRGQIQGINLDRLRE